MAAKKEKENDPNTWKEENDFPKEKVGVRHLIECNCILPQYRNRKDKIWHKFPVFSVIDEENNVIPKFAQCNNCGIIHKVVEINRSEISIKEKMGAIKTIDDIRISIPDQFAGLLEQHNCDLSVWEEVEFILENEKWDNFVVLAKDEENDGNIYGKILIIKSPILAKVEQFERSDLV